jgi:hypothetical protein
MKVSDVALEILAALAPLIVAVLGFLKMKIYKATQQQAEHSYKMDVAWRLTQLASDVVLELNQTVVKRVKEAKADDGKLDEAEAAAIKAEAVAMIKSHLGVKGLQEALSVLGFDSAGFDKFLGTQIERAVANEKTPKAF